MTKIYKILVDNRETSRHTCFVPDVSGNVSNGIFAINNDISCQCKIFFSVFYEFILLFIGNKKIFPPRNDCNPLSMPFKSE